MLYLRATNMEGKAMATITLEYDGRNTVIPKLIDIIVNLGARPVGNNRKKKCGLDEALEDIKKGRVYEAKSVDDMMKKILG